MVLYNLDDVVREIKLCKPKGFEEQELRKWLFEYACRTAEYEGIKPPEYPAYLNFLMVQKAHSIKAYIVHMYQKMHTNPNKQLEFTLPSYSTINQMILEEHKKRK